MDRAGRRVKEASTLEEKSAEEGWEWKEVEERCGECERKMAAGNRFTAWPTLLRAGPSVFNCGEGSAGLGPRRGLGLLFPLDLGPFQR
jgi:hypothetical protein